MGYFETNNGYPAMRSGFILPPLQSPPDHVSDPVRNSLLISALACAGLCNPVALAQESSAAPQDKIYPDMPDGRPPVLANEKSVAKKPADMQAYTDVIPGSKITFDMLAIPAGTFLMGSPASEEDRSKDEGPQVEVAVDPFWMGKFEVTWDEYQVFQFKLDQQQRARGEAKPTLQDPWADAVSRPTPPYVPMDFGMGVKGYPAACMTQFAARQYCKWLSQKTGRFYRLATEAEWEYACRAGTTTAYSFGDEVDDLDDYAWHYENADDAYQKIGQKKPNPWGLYDMHGNVAEWVIDQYDKAYYGTLAAKKGKDGKVHNPVHWPAKLYPRVARGGSWDDDPEGLRSAARKRSSKDWKVQDPQLPKSIWYLTDASFVGFRIVRPFKQPSAEEMARYWETELEEVRQIQEKQRHGGR
jgi:formylglycine-generating enzyme required for sulfatase activity